jgi:hypothetical protein
MVGGSLGWHRESRVVATWREEPTDVPTAGLRRKRG